MGDIVKVPTLNELTQEVGTYSKEEKAFITLLNEEVPAKWIKKHPMSKTEYIPIERIEYLLTRIFGTYSVELIKGPELLGNSVVVGVRVTVTNPITGKEIFHDGVGAQPLQMNKGAGAVDFNQMKSNAVQLAAPIAKSYAFKDACDHFGKIFGRDLNRATQIGYSHMMPKFEEESHDPNDPNPEETKRLTRFIKEAKTEQDLKEVYNNMIHAKRMDLEPIWKEKFNEIKNK